MKSSEVRKAGDRSTYMHALHDVEQRLDETLSYFLVSLNGLNT